MTSQATIDIGPWRLRREIALLQLLHLVATARKNASFRTAVHVALYDRYWRLGSWHRAIGNSTRAAELVATAIRWWSTSGADTLQPPPSSPPAIVQPIAWFFTAAVATYAADRPRAPSA